MTRSLFDDSRPQSIGTRLKKIRSDLGFSQSKLATEMGTGQHNLSRYETGQVELPIQAMTSLYNMGYNLNWLICGKGPIKHEENKYNVDKIHNLEKELQNKENKISELEIENNKRREELMQSFKNIVDLQNHILNIRKGK